MTVRVLLPPAFLKRVSWKPSQRREQVAEHNGKLLFELSAGNTIDETRVLHYAEFADPQDALVFKLRFGL